MMDQDKGRITIDILIEGIANKEDVPTSSIVINSFNINPGSNKGDNFACTILCIEINAAVKNEEKKYNFIAKVIPTNPQRAAFVEGSLLHVNEANFYHHLKPIINTLNSKFQLPLPDCYYSKTDSKVMIMENLKVNGYKLVDRQVGLDNDHMVLVLKELAKFHGLNHHYLVEKGISFMREIGAYRSSWFRETEANLFFKTFFHEGMVTIQNLMEDEGLEVQVIKKLLEKQNFLITLAEKNCIQKIKFQTIIHGDCWSSNFLFKYGDDGKPCSVKFVDLQVSRVGSPGIDLAHVMFTGTDPLLKQKMTKKWLEIYHEALSEVFVELDYLYPNLYTLDDLVKDFNDSQVYGTFIGCFMALSTQSKESEEGGALDVDKIDLDMNDSQQTMESTGIVDAMKRNKDVINRMKVIVQEALDKKIFDELLAC